MNIFLDNIIFSLQKSGGISVYWYELLKRINNDNDFSCQFIDFKGYENIFRNKLKIDNTNIILKKKALFQRYLPVKINSKNGVFHSSYYRYCSNRSIKNIVTVHDFTYEYFRGFLPKKIHNTQKKLAILNSDKVICISNNTKKDLLKFFPNTNKNKIEVIYNGISSEFFSIENCRNKIKKIIPFEKMEYAVYIGNRIPKYKNFELAVKSCSISKTPLVIVGTNLTKTELNLLNHYLKNNFKLILNPANELINLIYNNALCLLYPSAYEGFGLPVVEAQKAGCSVICSNSSSLGEVAGNGGVFFNDFNEYEISEKINLLISNNNFRLSKIKNGILNSDKFSWDLTYKKIKSIYKSYY